MPDENLMKFKKAHNTLGTVIRELVTSDKYFCDGDLGKKADCTTAVTIGQMQYFCNSIADIINTKEVNCYKSKLYLKMELYFSKEQQEHNLEVTKLFQMNLMG